MHRFDYFSNLVSQKRITKHLYIHYIDKSNGTPSLEEEKGTSKLWQQRHLCT